MTTTGSNTYTKEILAQIVEEYTANPVLETVEALAARYGLPRRSIISKLSALGIYQKKVYTTKEGTAPVRKTYYIEEISELLDIDISLIESLEKATKGSLRLVVEGILALKSELGGSRP